jgi:hypothetical protein
MTYFSLQAKVALVLISIFTLSAASNLGTGVSAQSGNSTKAAGNVTSIAEPEIAIDAGFATFSYGIVYVSMIIENAVPGMDRIDIEYYNPDGGLEESRNETISVNNGTGSFSCYCFSVERKYVEESYSVAVIYGNYSETSDLPPFSSVYGQPPSISFHAADQTDSGVHIGGRVSGGIGGEQVNVAIYPQDDNSPLWQKTLDSNGKVIFETFINNTEAQELLPTGAYKVIATHIATGVTGETTLEYTNPETAEEPEQEPISEPEVPRQDDSESDEQDEEEPASDDSGGAVRSPFVFEDEEDDKPIIAPASTSGESTNVAQADQDVLVINGTLASYYILDNATALEADMSQVYILAGNWSMTVNSTAVSDFAANFTIVTADGAARGVYSIANFAAVNSSNVQLGSDSITLASTADIQKGGSAANVNITIAIEKFNAIKIELGYPAGRPIYGVVDSLATVNNGELSIVPR